MSIIGYESQRLKTPLGFKGGAVTELWQVAAKIEIAGESAVGLGTQSVLWSDGDVFRARGEYEGNRLMLSVTEYAQYLVREIGMLHPRRVLDIIFDDVYRFARKVTGMERLKKTFALNALVPIDNALWQLYLRGIGTSSFDDVLTGGRCGKLVNIPLISYNTSLPEIESLLSEGVGLLKIKAGSDPRGTGDPHDMLAWDKRRLEDIHRVAQRYSSEHTVDGTVRYYLDANGRYPNKGALEELLLFADSIGALGRIELLEEPFAEECFADVSDLPVAVAMDESAHSVEDVLQRIHQGYRAIALKPIAKTLSLTLAMLEAARERSVICYCADLTVNPNLVMWNQNVAARLAPLPGMKICAFESNGAQNYKHWDRMMTYCPDYREPVRGAYALDDVFYRNNGGIFKDSPHYRSVAENGAGMAAAGSIPHRDPERRD